MKTMKKTKFPTESELKRVREALHSTPAARLLPKNASPVVRAKYAICEEIVRYKNKNNLTQRALADKIGIDEALISKIVHYQLDDFTTDRLIKYLNEIYPKVEVKISVA